MTDSIKPKFIKPSSTSSYFDREETTFTEAANFVYNKYLSQSIQVQREKLPIYNNRFHILYLLEKFQTLVLVGETGCGKSTQIPQYLIEAGWPEQIAVCEPRRVAACSLALRVAEETQTIIQGDTVGYAVRFDACNNKPKIKYVTEGILLREMMSDPLLMNYSVIMLDEVHERTIYTDILMGLMKKILNKRRELKLIVASATVCAKEIQAFFNYYRNGKDTSVIMTVQGRQYPVTIYYVLEPVSCYVQESINTALKIHSLKDPGDILIFLTSQEEVESAVKLLKEHAQSLDEKNNKNKLLILPLYGCLPHHEQLKVFRYTPIDHRKIVVSTNLAETSVTIPGIVYVIDCGFVKMRWFNNETHTDSLVTMPISLASANQRAGRAGRMKPGKVYRLFTENFLNNLASYTPPEMVRTKMNYPILQLKAMGIKNILKFKFLTPPPIQNIKSALEILYALGTIDINCNLTKPLGFNMAEFTLDPLLSKILLSSDNFGCSDEILSIISMLQVENIFTKPSSTNFILKARVQKRIFEVEEGDLITYLNVYNAFINSEMSREFCHKNFISYNSMKRVIEVRQQLEKMMRNYNVPLISCNGVTEIICKCLVVGLFPNAVYLHHSGVYKTIRGDVSLHIHPDSVLYTIKQAQWLLFCDVIHTKELYMRDLTVIKDEWLLELAPHFYCRTTHRDF